MPLHDENSLVKGKIAALPYSTPTPPSQNYSIGMLLMFKNQFISNFLSWLLLEDYIFVPVWMTLTFI